MFVFQRRRNDFCGGCNGSWENRDQLHRWSISKLRKEARLVDFNVGGDKFFMVMKEKVSVHEAARLLCKFENKKRVSLRLQGINFNFNIIVASIFVLIGKSFFIWFNLKQGVILFPNWGVKFNKIERSWFTQLISILDLLAHSDGWIVCVKKVWKEIIESLIFRLLLRGIIWMNFSMQIEKKIKKTQILCTYFQNGALPWLDET